MIAHVIFTIKNRSCEQFRPDNKWANVLYAGTTTIFSPLAPFVLHPVEHLVY